MINSSTILIMIKAYIVNSFYKAFIKSFTMNNLNACSFMSKCQILAIMFIQICLNCIFNILINWSRQVESLRLSWILDSSRLDLSQNFEIEYLSQVRMLISSIRVESWCWYRVLTRILDSTHQDMIYYY